ncbi:MAG: hypothetical protein H6814_05570 [Phycisphaeraceae bacterium]|nr:hypothetical protein [Phycisphaeraceae bacterium]
MTQAPTARATTTMMTRDGLIALSRRADPWAFLPVIDRAIAQAPKDLGLAMLGVRTLAALGLRTPALERLERCNTEIERIEGGAALRAGVEALPHDLIPLSRRLRMAERNIEALAQRGIDLRDPFERWCSREERWEHLRASGGNVIRRPAGSLDSAEWLWCADVRGGVERFVEESFRTINTDSSPGIVVEGAGPPWLLLALHERTRPNAFGYSPMLRLLQADPEEFFEGAAVADLRACLLDERVRSYFGGDATLRLRDDEMARLDAQQGSIGATANTVRTPLRPGVGAVIRAVTDHQAAEADRLHGLVAGRYAGRDPAWWASRYDEAIRPGADHPLRVLIVSCRYTTWVRHSASSLRDALSRLGCSAELLIEPDTHSYLHRLAFHRAFLRHDPDLIVLINYPRGKLRRSVPENIPFLCWVQDGMPHLFDERTGAAQGGLDFVAGHVYEAMLERFGFRPDRALRLPVAADGETFRPTGFSNSPRPEFDCEIAYVSHHSETPERMLERLIGEDHAGRYEPMLRAIADRLGPLLRSAVTGAFRVPLRRLVEEEVAEHVPGADIEGVVARTFHQFAIPLAERAIRHQTIGWASDIAARRGWRLALYGNGWETHPEFSQHARGSMEHGAALRDCYERAAVQLHASVCNPAHQRVQECALAGGLPLSRITRDALQVEYEVMRLGGKGGIEPAASDDARGLVGFRIQDDPELREVAAQLERLGITMEPGPDPGLLWIERSEWVRRDAATRLPTIDSRTRWLFGDCAACCFTDEAGLERLVERAIADPAWRRATSGAIASRVRERLTIDAIARRALGFVHEGIRADAGVGG